MSRTDATFNFFAVAKVIMVGMEALPSMSGLGNLDLGSTQALGREID
jgi:hypothetical protein